MLGGKDAIFMLVWVVLCEQTCIGLYGSTSTFPGLYGVFLHFTETSTCSQHPVFSPTLAQLAERSLSLPVHKP